MSDPLTDPLPDVGAAAALAPMVEVWFRMLEEHVPDGELHCQACTSGGTGARSTPWPCSLRTVADAARRRFAAGSGPVPVPAPRPPSDAVAPPRKRWLRGPRGIARALTQREQEFLQLAANGCTDSMIAMQLSVPVRTVATSIRRIARTLGAPDRGSLLVLALREGVIA